MTPYIWAHLQNYSIYNYLGCRQHYPFYIQNKKEFLFLVILFCNWSEQELMEQNTIKQRFLQYPSSFQNILQFSCSLPSELLVQPPLLLLQCKYHTVIILASTISMLIDWGSVNVKWNKIQQRNCWRLWLITSISQNCSLCSCNKCDVEGHWFLHLNHFLYMSYFLNLVHRNL